MICVRVAPLWFLFIATSLLEKAFYREAQDAEPTPETDLGEPGMELKW